MKNKNSKRSISDLEKEIQSLKDQIALLIKALGQKEYVYIPMPQVGEDNIWKKSPPIYPDPWKQPYWNPPVFPQWS